MYSNVKHRGFESWVLKIEDIEDLLEIMGGNEDISKIMITFMCKHSVRVYYSLDECKSEKNYNEDPIECMHVEVLVPGKGKWELNLHHVGIWPSSATISVNVTEEGTGAVAKKDEIIRRVRRMKPWWSWISWLHIDLVLIMIIGMAAIQITTPALLRPILEIPLISSTTFSLTVLLFLVAILFLISWFSGVWISKLVINKSIFPQGITTIGEGSDRLEKIRRRQKVAGYFGGIGITFTASIIVALVF